MNYLAKTVFALGLSAALPAATAPVSAAVVTSGIGSNFFTFSTSSAFVPINTVSGTPTRSLPFTLPTPASVAITFSAECAVDAPAGNTQAIVDYDIVVDGVAVGGTGGAIQTLCGANGIAGFDNFTHPSVTVVAPVSAGRHIVTVLCRLVNGATGGWVSDSVTVVER